MLDPFLVRGSVNVHPHLVEFFLSRVRLHILLYILLLDVVVGVELFDRYTTRTLGANLAADHLGAGDSLGL